MGAKGRKSHVGSFWSKVKCGLATECWPWMGYRKKSGHGLTSHNSKPMHASRKAWILTHGDIPDGLCVNHTCDNALCCNPEHMYLGTRADNMRDHWGLNVANATDIQRQRREERGRKLREVNALCAPRKPAT